LIDLDGCAGPNFELTLSLIDAVPVFELTGVHSVSLVLGVIFLFAFPI